MTLLLLLIRWTLAGVFVAAGVAKLADLDGSRQAMHDFGLPAAAARLLGLLLPLAEVSLALALIPAATAWWGALGALLLLAVFCGGIAVNMARGNRPNCHCFGQLHSQPIGWPTLARNGGLALLAALLVWQGPDATRAAAPTLLPLGYLGLIGGLLLFGLVAVQSWMVLHLLRQNGRLLLRVEALEVHLGLANPLAAADTPQARGLPVGTPAPAFRLATSDGGVQTLGGLLSRGKPVVLLFSSPTCGPCQELMPEAAKWQRNLAGRLTLAVVNWGDAAAMQAKAAEFGLDPLLLQQDGETAQAYRVPGTPAAVWIDAQGKIAGLPVMGVTAIRDLITRSVRPADPLRARLRPPMPIVLDGNGPANGPVNGLESGGSRAPLPAAPAPGQPAPAVHLPNLEGETLDLARYQGAPTLVIFWNPGCGYCRRMVDDLKRATSGPAAGAPQVVLISTGSVEANREQNLGLPTLLDEGFSAGFAFGARGTPSAVLLDAQGRIASQVMVGAPAILALLQPTSMLES